VAFLRHNSGCGIIGIHGFIIFFVILGSIPLPTPVAAENLTSAIKAQQKSQLEAVTSQQRIDKLDDETLAMLDEYRHYMGTLEDLKDYNAQMERQVVDQEQEILRKDAELADIEVTRRRIVPFMLRMLEVFEQFVELDMPFLPDERGMRVEQLQGLMDRSDISLAEKYRRLLEAYSVEAEYGHNIEAYQGTLNNSGEERTVEFLRLGRIGLFYLSLDGSEAGSWHPLERRWVSLDNEYRDPIKQAILIANKQLPPNLVKLPLPAPETTQ